MSTGSRDNLRYRAAPYRNPATGTDTYPITATICVAGEPLPRIYRLGSWEALAGFIASAGIPDGG